MWILFLGILLREKSRLNAQKNLCVFHNEKPNLNFFWPLFFYFLRFSFYDYCSILSAYFYNKLVTRPADFSYVFAHFCDLSCLVDLRSSSFYSDCSLYSSFFSRLFWIWDPRLCSLYRCEILIGRSLYCLEVVCGLF